jgi:hypothetical protein
LSNAGEAPMLSRRQYRTRDGALSPLEARVLAKLPWEMFGCLKERKVGTKWSGAEGVRLSAREA